MLYADLLVVPLVVACVYQWNRITDESEDAINCPNELAVAEYRYRGILTFCVLGLLGSLALSILTGRAAVASLVAVAFFSGLLYSSYPGRHRFGRFRLKRFLFLKNWSSALGWALITVIYPVLHAREEAPPGLWVAFVTMFLAVWTVELIWDLRDSAGDAIAGVQSIPVVFGPKAAQGFAHATNLAALLVVFTGGVIGLVPKVWPLFLVNFALTCAYLIFVRPDWGRTPSHVLVSLQTLLLFALGALSPLIAHTPT
jgi:4-hydroxybenzoate polyprenyltransferase